MEQPNLDILARGRSLWQVVVNYFSHHVGNGIPILTGFIVTFIYIAYESFFTKPLGMISLDATFHFVLWYCLPCLLIAALMAMTRIQYWYFNLIKNFFAFCGSTAYGIIVAVFINNLFLFITFPHLTELINL